MLHGAGAPFAFGGHAGHVEGVGGEAVADDFGEDLCAAGFGELELLEDEDACAFSDDEAVTVPCRKGGWRAAGRRYGWTGRAWRRSLRRRVG